MARRSHTSRQDRSALSGQNTPRIPRQTESKRWDKSLQSATESGAAAKASLIDSFLSNVRNVNLLDEDNVNIDNCPVPKRSDPPKNNFVNEQARTATLVAGVACDARAMAVQSLGCGHVPFMSALIPIEGSQWPIRPNSDMDNYGIESHGQYTKFLAVVEAPKLSQDYVPDIGKQVQMYFDMEYKFEKIPVTEMWPEDVEKIVNEFSREFQDTDAAYSYTLNADGQTMDEVVAAQDVSLSREELDKIRLDCIRKRMAKLILPNIPYELTDKQRNGLTTAEARIALAADAIKTIITEHDQCPQEQRALLESWLEKNNTVQANTDDVDWTDIKWHGRRIIQVPGIVSGFQYYLLSTPKHPNWPPDLQPPPLRFVYDKPDVNGSVQALHDSLKLVIRTVIFYRAKVEVLKFKGRVCHTMNNLKDGSRGLHWWRYALNFNPAVSKTIKVNLLSEFPGIAAGLANGRFRGEHAQAARALEFSNAGKFILQGGPGAGKSAFIQTCLTTALEKDTVLNGISKRTTAVYTTSTNAMVNNAYTVFAERNPNRRAARAFMFREEVLAVLLYENMHRNEAQEDTEQNTSSAPRHQAISVFRQHVENITQSNRELYSPRQHEHSLAAIAIQRIIADPNSFISHCWPMRTEDPDSWKALKKTLLERIKELLKAIILELDVIFCTPHTAKDLKNNCQDWNPTLVIIDKAGLLTETQLLVPISCWPHAATLIVGDPNQLRPIVPSYRKKLRCETLAEKEDDVKVFEFDDLVSEQRRYPILARAQALHGVDFTLRENHRVYGSAGEYMSRNMFNGSMVCTHLGDRAASASLSEYVNENLEASKNLVWFDLDGAVETAAGTSYVNTAQARFCVELALQFCRECDFPLVTDWLAWKNGKLEKKGIRRGRVLIICMYAQQRELILSMLQQVPTHEYDLSHIEVRSVDQCLGHYREVVIMSIGRSAGAGHTRDIKRSNVALTRHILFLATVSSSEVGDKLGNNLKRYRQYHDKHNLRKQIKGWHLWCEKCCQHGHSQERCGETLVCGFCRGPHAGRNCTKVPRDKATVADERWTEGATDNCWPPATEAVVTAPAALTLEDGNKRLVILDNLQRSVLYKSDAAQKGKQPKVIVCPTRSIVQSQRRAN
ncbi:prematurely terminated mRNA decay factor [Beauveria bassiana ARSEF 2860]|uniref:Prematurely terminated mRNA decay factor n=1 Tax=Beauveria bassiana (strain ARSEF 2860) TaxID=655819 RepID=J5K1K4_BEAB2|nr:prematurely terminated mRNA decay factor [Beauveria bassiana ARSEF 2860]EJP70313.1 prematurely terminated mRNA decay factor [Beauveria bassiana ARSEF 2860]